MATRCNIVKINTDYTVTVIYCHYDGYYEWTGEMIAKHYTDLEKINALIALGDIKQLKPEIDEIETFDKPAQTYQTLKQYADTIDRGYIEYVYMYNENNGTWKMIK